MRCQAFAGTALSIVALAIVYTAPGIANARLEHQANMARGSFREGLENRLREHLENQAEIAVGPGNRVYVKRIHVGDSLTQRIFEYSSSGSLIRSWPVWSRPASADLQGIGQFTVDSNGQVYFLYPPEMHVFSQDGTAVRTWHLPETVKEPGEFAVGKNGTVYIIDGMARVVKLSQDGRLLARSAPPDTIPGRLAWLTKISVGRKGIVHGWVAYMSLSDADAPAVFRINSYDSAGKLLSSSPTPVHVVAWGPDGSIYTYRDDFVVQCDIQGRVVRRWGPFPWRTDGALRLLAVPSATEMYLLFIPHTGSSPIIQRVSQKDGRVLAQWELKPVAHPAVERGAGR